ncbi:hypothetical protein LINPERPRIM_LOCUS42 [Linum perenne]
MRGCCVICSVQTKWLNGSQR